MSAFITEEQLKNLYDYATDESYNALVIDATKGKPIFKKNFESILKNKLVFLWHHCVIPSY